MQSWIALIRQHEQLPDIYTRRTIDSLPKYFSYIIYIYNDITTYFNYEKQMQLIEQKYPTGYAIILDSGMINTNINYPFNKLEDFSISYATEKRYNILFSKIVLFKISKIYRLYGTFKPKMLPIIEKAKYLPDLIFSIESAALKIINNLEITNINNKIFCTNKIFNNITLNIGYESAHFLMLYSKNIDKYLDILKHKNALKYRTLSNIFSEKKIYLKYISQIFQRKDDTDLKDIVQNLYNNIYPKNNGSFKTESVNFININKFLTFILTLPYKYDFLERLNILKWIDDIPELSKAMSTRTHQEIQDNIKILFVSDIVNKNKYHITGNVNRVINCNNNLYVVINDIDTKTLYIYDKIFFKWVNMFKIENGDIFYDINGYIVQFNKKLIFNANNKISTIPINKVDFIINDCVIISNNSSYTIINYSNLKISKILGLTDAQIIIAASLNRYFLIYNTNLKKYQIYYLLQETMYQISGVFVLNLPLSNKGIIGFTNQKDNFLIYTVIDTYIYEYIFSIN